MTRAREGEFWDLTFGMDARVSMIAFVQAWAGIESVFVCDGCEEVIWIPQRELGTRHDIETTREAAIALAEKDGAASGLPRWTESKP